MPTLVWSTFAQTSTAGNQRLPSFRTPRSGDSEPSAFDQVRQVGLNPERAPGKPNGLSLRGSVGLPPMKPASAQPTTPSRSLFFLIAIGGDPSRVPVDRRNRFRQ